MQQIWTTIQHDALNHLGLWLIGYIRPATHLELGLRECVASAGVHLLPDKAVQFRREPDAKRRAHVPAAPRPVSSRQRQQQPGTSDGPVTGVCVRGEGGGTRPE